MIQNLFGGAVVGLLGGAAGWFVGRLHLRKTQLKGLDQSLHLPDGTLEDKVNAAVEAAAILAQRQAIDKVRQP